jgi:hypothetical protein
VGNIEVVRKFVESNRIIERLVREGVERLPLKFRYGISYGPTFRYWLAFLNRRSGTGIGLSYIRLSS